MAIPHCMLKNKNNSEPGFSLTLLYSLGIAVYFQFVSFLFLKIVDIKPWCTGIKYISSDPCTKRTIGWVSKIFYQGPCCVLRFYLFVLRSRQLTRNHWSFSSRSPCNAKPWIVGGHLTNRPPSSKDSIHAFIYRSGEFHSRIRLDCTRRMLMHTYYCPYLCRAEFCLLKEHSHPHCSTSDQYRVLKPHEDFHQSYEFILLLCHEITCAPRILIHDVVRDLERVALSEHLTPTSGANPHGEDEELVLDSDSTWK